MRTRALLTLAALAMSAMATAQPTPGAPQMPSRVVLVPSRCPQAFPDGGILAQLRAELRTDGVDQVELAASSNDDREAIARVSVEPEPCETGATVFIVVVDDVLTRKRVSRPADLRGFAGHRDRWLAQNVAELLRASWLELSRPSVPRSPVPVPPAVANALQRLLPSSAPVPPMPEALRWTPFVALHAELRGFPNMSTAVSGLRLVGGATTPWWGQGRRIRLRADAGVSFGGEQSFLGITDLLVVTGALAITFGRPGTLSYEMGPRVELGFARATGEASTGVLGHTHEGALLTTGALFALHGCLTQYVCPTLEVDVGWTFGGIDATELYPRDRSEVSVLGVSGPTVALRLGIGWDR